VKGWGEGGGGEKGGGKGGGSETRQTGKAGVSGGDGCLECGSRTEKESEGRGVMRRGGEN